MSIPSLKFSSSQNAFQDRFPLRRSSPQDSFFRKSPDNYAQQKYLEQLCASSINKILENYGLLPGAHASHSSDNSSYSKSSAFANFVYKPYLPAPVAPQQQQVAVAPVAPQQQQVAALQPPKDDTAWGPLPKPEDKFSLTGEIKGLKSNQQDELVSHKKKQKATNPCNQNKKIQNKIQNELQNQIFYKLNGLFSGVLSPQDNESQPIAQYQVLASKWLEGESYGSEDEPQENYEYEEDGEVVFKVDHGNGLQQSSGISSKINELQENFLGYSPNGPGSSEESNKNLVLQQKQEVGYGKYFMKGVKAVGSSISNIGLKLLNLAKPASNPMSPEQMELMQQNYNQQQKPVQLTKEQYYKMLKNQKSGAKLTGQYALLKNDN